MNKAQQLAISVNIYGEMMGIKNYYEIYKILEFGGESATSISEEVLSSKLESVLYGIKGFESGALDPYIELQKHFNLISKNFISLFKQHG